MASSRIPGHVAPHGLETALWETIGDSGETHSDNGPPRLRDNFWWHQNSHRLLAWRFQMGVQFKRFLKFFGRFLFISFSLQCQP